MKWCFIDTDGIVKVFSAECTEIYGFCGGGYFHAFQVWPYDSTKYSDWNKPDFADNPLPSPQALFESVIGSASTAFVLFADVYRWRGGANGGVAYELFKDIKEGVVAGNFSYVVDHSPPTFNWNSGNDCLIMTVRKTDLANRFESDDEDGELPCGCCACCGCSCDLDDDSFDPMDYE